MPYVVRHVHVSVSLQHQESFQLLWMSAGSLEFLLGLDDHLDDREFCVRFIQYQLVDPKLDFDEVRNLSDKVLSRIAREWAKDRLGLGQSLPRGKSAFSAFKGALITYRDNETEKLRETFEKYTTAYSGIAHSVVDSFALAVMPSITPAINNIVGDIHPILDPSKILGPIAVPPIPSYPFQSLLSDFKAFQLPPLLIGLDKSLAINALSAIQETVAQVANSILSVPLYSPSIADLLPSLEIGKLWTGRVNSNLSLLIKEIASHATLATTMVQQVFNDAFRASEAFSAYYQIVLGAALETPDIGITPQSRLIAPPRTTAATLGAAFRVGFKDADPQKIEVVDESIIIAQGERDNDIELSLAIINPRFADKWRGCWLALKSNNPDKICQAAHSGRELISQVLHTLAPDEVFTPEELELHGRKGKNPTRKMRIARILGTRTDSTAVELIESVAKAIDSLYDVLSATAHDHSGNTLEITLTGYLITLKGMLILLLN